MNDFPRAEADKNSALHSAPASASSVLLAWRDYQGIGDWIMALSVLKMCRAQYPDVVIHLNLMVDGKPLSPFLVELIRSSDVDVIYTFHKEPKKAEGYSCKTSHIIYKKPIKHVDKHLIASMVDAFNENTGLDVQYDKDCLATFRPIELICKLPVSDYILMPSRGKSTKPRGKEWGYENFNKLFGMLSSHYPVIQVGAEDDPLFEGVSLAYLGREPDLVYHLMAQCRIFVGVVNGLCHLAGHMGTKSYIVYCDGDEDPIRTGYPGQVALMWDARPEAVYEAIMEQEAVCT